MLTISHAQPDGPLPYRLHCWQPDREWSLHYCTCKLLHSVILSLLFGQTRLSVDCLTKTTLLISHSLTSVVALTGDANSFSPHTILLWDRHHFCKLLCLMLVSSLTSAAAIAAKAIWPDGYCRTLNS